MSEPKPRRSRSPLSQAWNGVKKDRSASWLLAGHYHSAILGRMSPDARNKMPRPSQATAWTREFLALERRRDSTRLPEVLRNFTRVGPWLNTCPDQPLAQEALAR